MTQHPWGVSTPEMNAGVLETGSTAATWAAACLAEAGAPRGDAAVATQPLGATCIPDPAAVEVHAAAHAQFTAAFEALRPLGLGRP